MNTYKKFFITLILTIISLVALSCCLVILAGKIVIGNEKICSFSAQVVRAWNEQKGSYANELSKKGEKIVLVSGSSGVFGINSKILKAEKMPIVNYSTHAGLCSYIFYDAKKVLNPKDTVLLPLEYGFYNDSYEIGCLNEVLLPYVIGYDREYFNQLDLRGKFKTWNFLLTRSFYEKLRIGNQSIKNVEGGIYSYMLDADGDVMENFTVKEGFSKNNPIVKLEASITDPNYKKWELYKFIKWCKENNIRVIGMFPPAFHGENSMSKKELEASNLIKKFYKDAGAEFIGELQDTFYSEEYMYDTNYHLNYKGRDKHTRYLINLLRENNIK